MSARFVSGARELSFQGTWQVFGELNGRSVLAMKGTWSGKKNFP